MPDRIVSNAKNRVDIQHNKLEMCIAPLNNHLVVVVVVRLEHSNSFTDSLDNNSTASGPASCIRRRPPGNTVNCHSSTMCLVVWWLPPQGQAGDAITPRRW